MKSSIFKTLALASILVPSLSLAQTWTAPTQAAPAGNTSTPLNVSSTDQVKSGGISVGALSVTGNAALTGVNSTLTIGGVPLRSMTGNGFAAGVNAGSSSSGYGSNFIGTNAGKDATNASYSNFIGIAAGISATNAASSTFIGSRAGAYAAGAVNSNFIGADAGMFATAAQSSNFIGASAGFNATAAQRSNFIGALAGWNASNAPNSNFLGNLAGAGSTNANYSNFIGDYAGQGTPNASYSNFIGGYAGSGAQYANNSIFIGFDAGFADGVNNLGGGHSILLGDFTSTGGFSNSVSIGSFTRNTAAGQLNIGQLIYATGIATSTVAYPYSPISGGKVGIGVAVPTATLDVAGSVKGTSLCIGSTCKSTWPTSAGAWFTWTSGGGLLTGYGVASVTLSSGRPLVTLSSTMSSVNYAVMCSGGRTGSIPAPIAAYGKTTTTFLLESAPTGSLTDVDCVVFGS
jgi:hypothetical protein